LLFENGDVTDSTGSWMLLWHVVLIVKHANKSGTYNKRRK